MSKQAFMQEAHGIVDAAKREHQALFTRYKADAEAIAARADSAVRASAARNGQPPRNQFVRAYVQPSRYEVINGFWTF